MVAALTNMVDPIRFFLMTSGIAVGIIVGALPGLTATMALALLVPFTFVMDASTSLMVLGGVYVGAIYGGCIAAILINTPGTPSSIATTFDGFPLTKKGMAEHALVAAAFSSGVGGVLGALGLLFLSPPLAKVALNSVRQVFLVGGVWLDNYCHPFHRFHAQRFDRRRLWFVVEHCGISLSAGI